MLLGMTEKEILKVKKKAVMLSGSETSPLILQEFCKFISDFS
jgi:hypothetical protein